MTDMTQDQALLRLYQHLTTKPGTGFTSLGEDDRKAYMRDAMRRSRAKKRDAAEAGRLGADRANVRGALADAAMMLLATNGPGSKEILAALGRIFGADRAGIPFTVLNDCRTGKLTPKLIKA